jgi:hypothetical protein
VQEAVGVAMLLGQRPALDARVPVEELVGRIAAHAHSDAILDVDEDGAAAVAEPAVRADGAHAVTEQ